MALRLKFSLCPNDYYAQILNKLHSDKDFQLK